MSGVARADGPPTTAPASPPPATNVALAVPATAEGFDPADHLLGDLFGLRPKLARDGITFDPYLIVDYSKVLLGGLDTHGDSFRERFNFPVQLDTEPLFGLHGGTIVAIYQLQNGGNASHQFTGDAQNFSFATDANDRSQLGQLWYQQLLFDDTVRIRAGKLDANSDFDVMDNVQEFLNNSFQTSPTLALMPSFPDTGTGVQIFFEPKSGFYAGTGVFDGSGARGVETGEVGPQHFFDRPEDLFLIAETGARYKLRIANRKWPGKLAFGAWYDTNPFDRLDGNGKTKGTGGAYLTFDQLLWRPYRQRPVTAGPPFANPQAQPEEEEYPGGIGMSASLGWADPLVNRIDFNALAGVAWTGPITGRPLDVFGVGATYAHFSRGLETRDDYELAIETLYRIRFTRYISLKPDLQYIIHPSGSGTLAESIRPNTLVVDLRLEVAF